MPRRGENIYKRKDGRWEGRLIRGHHPNGKAIYQYVYGKSYSEAKTQIIRLAEQAQCWSRYGQSKSQIQGYT